MPIVRASADNQIKRVLGFRAWHRKFHQMGMVKSCDFTDLDAEAQIQMTPSGPIVKAKMQDIVLLQDTNMTDAEGTVVFEGDLVVADVENALGSYERIIAEVIFDETAWGYGLDFDKYSGLPLTGEMAIVRVVGNVFEGPNDQLVKEVHEQKNRHEEG